MPFCYQLLTPYYFLPTIYTGFIATFYILLWTGHWRFPPPHRGFRLTCLQERLNSRDSFLPPPNLRSAFPCQTPANLLLLPVPRLPAATFSVPYLDGYAVVKELPDGFGSARHGPLPPCSQTGPCANLVARLPGLLPVTTYPYDQPPLYLTQLLPHRDQEERLCQNATFPGCTAWFLAAVLPATLLPIILPPVPAFAPLVLGLRRSS